MKKTKTSRYDVAEHLRTPEEIAAYLEACLDEAKGDAALFNNLYREYAKAREVTRQRMYLETMSEILDKVGRKLITDDEAAGILPLFQLDKEGLKNAK